MDTTNSQLSSQIEGDVRTQIAGDPRIPYPAEIAVEVVDRVATLQGTVGSFAQRHAAVADARRTAGIEYVDDWLQVRLLDRDRREDAEIRGAALQRLMWDPELRPDFLDVHVKNGWATLKGDVDYQFQSDKVFDHVATLAGVSGITNHLKVVQAF